MIDDPRRPLTARQQDVVALIGRGLSYPDIGRVLQIAPRTVKDYAATAAQAFANPDELEPWKLLFLWARWSAWRAAHPDAQQPAA